MQYVYNLSKNQNQLKKASLLTGLFQTNMNRTKSRSIDCDHNVEFKLSQSLTFIGLRVPTPCRHQSTHLLLHIDTTRHR